MYNFSERALAIASDTNPSVGADPHRAAEAARKQLGFGPEEVLPFNESVKSVEEFYSPKPLTKEIIAEGRKFFDKYELKHEWVWTYSQNLSPIEKKERLEEALTKGTVCVSVYAWAKNEHGLYFKPPGSRDTHWTMLLSSSEENYKVYDSYVDDDTFVKPLDPLFDFGISKIYYLLPATKLSTWKKFLKWFRDIIRA